MCICIFVLRTANIIMRTQILYIGISSDIKSCVTEMIFAYASTYV